MAERPRAVVASSPSRSTGEPRWGEPRHITMRVRSSQFRPAAAAGAGAARHQPAHAVADENQLV